MNGTSVIKNKGLIEDIYFPLSILRERAAPGARLLDVGCALGYFLGCCDQHGLETYGIEVDEDSLEKAKKETCAALFLRDVNKGLALFEKDFFDYVTAFDVIEHLDDPAFFLKECLRILKGGGLLIVTTPNLASAARMIFRDKWYGYMDKTHQHFFTPTTLASVFEQVGYKIKRLETPFHPLSKALQFCLNRTGWGGQIWIVGEK